MLELRIDFDSNVPPSQQLQEIVLDAICGGLLKEGDRLPSVRTVAAEAMVNPNTVSKAWRALELQGVVELRNGSGVFVTRTGFEFASRTRGHETIQEFERAARTALRAGHGQQALQTTLDRITNGK